MRVKPVGIFVPIAIAIGLALVVAIVVRLATDPSDPAERTAAPVGRGGTPFVGAADFTDLSPSSPGAVVLRWWQANQFRQPPRIVAAFYATANRPPLSRLEADLRLTRYIFRSSKPLVLDQRAEAGRARVFVLLPPPGDPVTSRDGKPYVFDLVRERGRWKLADEFVASRAAAERQFARDGEVR
jgi:hypothetical protein